MTAPDTIEKQCRQCGATNRIPCARLQNNPVCGRCRTPLFAPETVFPSPCPTPERNSRRTAAPRRARKPAGPRVRGGNGINPAQMRLLHTAIKQLGMDEETYRAMLQNVVGVSSPKELTSYTLEIVMGHLKARGFVQKTSERPPKHKGNNPYERYLRKWSAAMREHRPGMATPAQLALIEALWDEAAPYWNGDGAGDRERSLRGFLRRATGRTEELRFLKFEPAHAIIEALKKVRSRRPNREPKANFCS